MSEKTRKQDRRTRYTRQTIKDTFLELLKQKSFTKITVTEVCKNAEINRGTFYLHYYDIYDVLSDIFNDMTQDMLTTVDHLFCLNQKSCSYPFCQKIQMESQYRALFLDDAIAPILLEKIAENTKVDIPEELVEDELNHMLRNFEEQIRMQGLSLEVFYEMTKSTEEDLRNQMKDEANKHVLYRIILEKVKELEKVDVTLEEADKEAEELAKKYNVEKEEFLNMYGGLEMLKYELEVKKVLEILMKENEK